MFGFSAADNHETHRKLPSRHTEKMNRHMMNVLFRSSDPFALPISEYLDRLLADTKTVVILASQIEIALLINEIMGTISTSGEGIQALVDSLFGRTGWC